MRSYGWPERRRRSSIKVSHTTTQYHGVHGDRKRDEFSLKSSSRLTLWPPRRTGAPVPRSTHQPQAWGRAWEDLYHQVHRKHVLMINPYERRIKPMGYAKRLIGPMKPNFGSDQDD
jgi:hypothetical protein